MREPAVGDVSVAAPGREVGPTLIIISLLLGALQACFTYRLTGKVQWLEMNSLWLLWLACGLLLWLGPREWVEPRPNWRPNWCRFSAILLFFLSIPFFWSAFDRWKDPQRLPAITISDYGLDMESLPPLTLLAVALLLLLSGWYLMRCARWLQNVKREG